MINTIFYLLTLLITTTSLSMCLIQESTLLKQSIAINQQLWMHFNGIHIDAGYNTVTKRTFKVVCLKVLCPTPGEHMWALGVFTHI